jgi:3-mercaptopyruvate sulfurtransferase SseA
MRLRTVSFCGEGTLHIQNRAIFLQHRTLRRQEIRMKSTISTKDLKSKLDQKRVTVVETLAPERYRDARIPGALNIPPEQIRELAPQLLPNKNGEIVTYCANTH